MKSIKDIPWECGKGWWSMIEKVASAIDSYNATHPDSLVEVTQIKQKFGGLRIYHHNAPEDIRQLIGNSIAVSLVKRLAQSVVNTGVFSEDDYVESSVPEIEKKPEQGLLFNFD